MIGMLLEKTPNRIAALADQCVQCGLCLPVCPTYALDRNEAESPRGRIAIAAALAKGEVVATPGLREHLDHCLGCLGCERVCPANVQYAELLVETRALLGPSPQRPRGLLALLKRPALLKPLLAIAALLRVPKWQLPLGSAWRTALSLLPTRSARAPTSPVSATPTTPALGVVALFPGCIASIADAEAQQATIRLLGAAGYRVVQLPAFCCGALDLHGGAAEAAEQAAQRVRQAWAASGAQHLLTVTPGCLGTLRRALPGVSVAAPYSLLASQTERLHFRPLARRAALHLPCTQTNVARSDATLLQLLRRIPELDVAPLPSPPYCCGAAGSHLLEFPERASRLRGDMLRRAADLAPQLLLSSNIGCRLHLAAGMNESGHAWPHLHPLTLLAQQLENAPVESL
ncbi:(Fe-S)-binding protein [Dyella tabacisoli]|uniref:Glycolate oxidase iron-sulfur subunit n=1 Tax=Dyella tabacisoli TaxID=2282381 RepID=A0A369UN45_9GAMM|nr:(Fe-S)-binding protein [Dyella tabacisoli]RDD81897.1 (Fe-S)-binding protein [Dyella tabacisoli]